MTDLEENECCPLCLEELDLTDKTFDACKCGYQVSLRQMLTFTRESVPVLKFDLI